MTNTLGIIRALLIYGLCLPLAVYVGYVLAMPLDRPNLIFLAATILLPLIPLLLRWHHFMLIASWNMSVVLFFLPASPQLWVVLTAVSLMLTVLQYILKRNVVFANIPSVSLPLLFLLLVVVITANLTGGIGLRAFGSESYGGKRYIMIFAAIAGYFAMTSQRVPEGRGGIYVALFFLGSATMIMGSIAPWMPSGLRYIYALFPVENLEAMAGAEIGQNVRLGGATASAAAVSCLILAFHGVRGLVAISERWHFLPLRFKGGWGINQPWRILSFLGLLWFGLLGGYRSTLIMTAMLLFFLFYFEGLFRTRLLPVVVLLGILGIAITLPLVDKMPLMVQRSLSFLPIEVDPIARQDAQNSSDWRLKMWREAIPTIPRYLLIGKGYSINAREMEAAQVSEYRPDASTAGAALASDFHNGPLSVIIPLGAFGALAFLWFLGASFRVFLNNYRYGEPALRSFNTFLLAYFLTKTAFFFLIFGSFQNELMMFTGLVGLSAAINGGMRQPAKANASAPNPAYLPFRLPKAAKA